jgi:hypothetical protein
MLSLHIVVDLHVAVNSTQVLLVVVETLECVPFPLLSGYEIFRIADGIRLCAIF